MEKGKTPVTFEDLWRLKFVGDPDVSPDGNKIAWVQTSINADKNAYESNIWMSSKKTEESGISFENPKRITYGMKSPDLAAREGSPRFSPDGKCLAFTSNRSGQNQIWILDLARGGEARQLTQGEEGKSGITWSPDGSHIAFVCREPKEKEEEEPHKSKDVTVVTKLRYKANGVPYVVDPRPRQIFMINVENGEQRQLTFGEYDCYSPVLSPDGKSIAFNSCREPDCEIEGVPDIWVLTLETGEMKKLTDGRGPAGSPVYSPDGEYIAYYGNLRKDVAAAKSEILTIPAQGGEPRVLTENFDRSMGCSVSTDSKMDAGGGGPYWSGDGRFIYFLATDRGYSKIFRVAVDTCEICEVYGSGVCDPCEVISGEGQDCSLECNCPGEDSRAVTPSIIETKDYPPVISSFAFSDQGAEAVFAFIGGSELNPADVYVARGVSDQPLELKAGCRKVKGWQYRVVSHRYTFDKVIRLTSVNEDVLTQVNLSKPEPFIFQSPDGLEIEGWMIRPVGFDAVKKYPAVLEIHGGPAVTYGLAFFHEFQLLASNGYGVFYCNPRGSLGYGEWFAQQVIADQGGMDYQDIMALRTVMDGVGWVDDSKVGVTGGSYGGYMTNWIVGHTDKFAAAVTQRSISNWYTKYGTSDIGFYGNKKGMGNRDLWDSEGWLMEGSPIRYVPNVNTPILILHSEQDYRCPMEQAEQWYVALKRLGKTVEFVRFAGENHELSRSGKPWNRKERLAHMLRWFDQYLK